MNRTPTLRSQIVAAFLAGACSTASAANDFSALRAEFRSALEAAEKGQKPAESSALKTYPLYPYLLAAQLRQELENPSAGTDSAVAQFLKDAGDQPVAHRLRGEWWLNLAQREQWAQFLAEVPETAAEPALQCLRFTGWIKAGGGAALREQMLRVWMTGEQMPQSCVFPFDWLKQQDALSEDLLERRARLALTAGNPDLADFLVRQLPENKAASLNRWIRLLRNPERELTLLSRQGDAALEEAAVLDAWTRLTRNSPAAAEPLLRPLLKAQKIKDGKAVEFVRALALGLAWDHAAQSLRYFHELPEKANDERSYEWRVRAALWRGEWKLARNWIERMPQLLAAQPRWRYWLARTMEQTSQAEAARSIYRTLQDANNYYAILASARLRLPVLPKTQPAPADDPEMQKRLQADPAIIRGRELFLLDRGDWARTEMQFALENADKSTRLQAARLVSSWGWHVQAITSAAKADVFDDFDWLYPQPYEKPVKAAADLTGLRPAWIYSVLRQESLYDPRAVSRRDACGLLQLLLPTARSVAKRWQRPLPARDDLFLPEVNIPLGAAYLRELTDKFGGQFVLALAAYNAGAATVARWLPPQAMAADIWIENIPFNETRSYIQKILWHSAVFGWRENGRPQDLSALLQPVTVTTP